MFLRPRQRAAAGANVPAVSESEPLPGNGGIDNNRSHEASADGKDRGVRPWRVRVRSAAMQAALWACRGACALAAFMCLFAWLRRLAMLEVVAASRRSWADVDKEEVIKTSFTVLVNTFQRPQQMEGALRHYTSCEGVDSVRVVWSEQTPLPDRSSAPHLFELDRPVKFHSHKTTSINNRFIPPSDLATDAVFVVDDDVEVPCGHLLAAFGTWQNHPDTIVGFYPRSHLHLPPSAATLGAGVWEYLYFWRVLLRMEYSIILTKAAFLHARFLRLYSGSQSKNAYAVVSKSGVENDPLVDHHEPEVDTDWFAEEEEGISGAMIEVRQYVDAHRNCEDIAMQMVVTMSTGFPPVAVFAPIRDIGLLGGISTDEGKGRWWKAPHAQKRSNCLADLSKMFHTHTATPSINDGKGSVGQPHGWRGDSLVHTNLFAMPPRRGLRRVKHDGNNNAGTEDAETDLRRISRLSLALRAPTLAEFISADMVMVPSRVWRWLAKEDIFGRTSLDA